VSYCAQGVRRPRPWRASHAVVRLAHRQRGSAREGVHQAARELAAPRPQKLGAPPRHMRVGAPLHQSSSTTSEVPLCLEEESGPTSRSVREDIRRIGDAGEVDDNSDVDGTQG
jgi:hypothetical protein